MSNEIYYVLGTKDKELQSMLAEGILHRAWKYIRDRRPFETVTLAILNEKYFDLFDARDGAARAKSIN